MCSCSLFFRYHRDSFLSRWPLAFLIFTPPLWNFHVILPKSLVSFVFSSIALAHYLFSTSRQTLELSRKKESALLVLFFISEIPGGSQRFNAKRRGYLKCKISPQLTWRGGQTYGRTDDFLRTKFSYPWCSATNKILKIIIEFSENLASLSIFTSNVLNFLWK